MTEKKFITSFIEYLDNEKWRGIIPNYDAIDEWLNDWLIEHHKTYREVYFYKRDLKVVEMQKEQVRIKLKDFLNFAFCHFDSTFVDEIVEKYINERLYRW
jgi:hypothetical protein